MSLLEVADLRKSFPRPEGGRALVIDVGRFALGAGEPVALEGASGAGKTTFLNLIAGLLRADSGRILLDGRDMAALTEPQRDAHRANTLSYVFQTFNLLQGCSALENVLLGMMFGPGPDEGRARALLERVGLGDRLRHRPAQLSTGQQQRVAIARALANRPKLVLADEPTGNLDARNAREAIDLLRGTCREEGAALLLVTHDAALLREFPRVESLAALNRASAGEAA